MKKSKMMQGFQNTEHQVVENLVVNYAFLSHMIHHLHDNDGKLGLVLANGSMSIGGNEEQKYGKK